MLTLEKKGALHQRNPLILKTLIQNNLTNTAKCVKLHLKTQAQSA